MSLLLWLVILIISLAVLVKAADYFTDASEKVGLFFKISPFIIGVTIVSVGTSLPELATAIVAARKGRVDLAVGNVVGSNIFNTFFVLGTTATVAPLPFTAANLIDSLAFIAATLVLFAALFVGTKQVLGRGEGVAFLLFYFGYIGYSILVYTQVLPLVTL